MTIALPSQRRFECDFQAMYAVQVLQRQARWYAVLDAITRTVGLVTASVFIAAFCLDQFDLAVYAGALLMGMLFMQATFRPRTQWDDSLDLRNAFVTVRTEASRLTDRQYMQRLSELQESSRVNIWRWLARSTCSNVCKELGCFDEGAARASRRDVADVPRTRHVGR